MAAQIIQMAQHSAATRRNLDLSVPQFRYTTTFDLDHYDYPELEELGFDELEMDVLVHYGFDGDCIGVIEHVEFVNALTRKPVHIAVDLQDFKTVITAKEVNRLEDFYAEDVAQALDSGEAQIDNFIRG